MRGPSANDVKTADAVYLNESSTQPPFRAQPPFVLGHPSNVGSLYVFEDKLLVVECLLQNENKSVGTFGSYYVFIMRGNSTRNTARTARREHDFLNRGEENTESANFARLPSGPGQPLPVPQDISWPWPSRVGLCRREILWVVSSVYRTVAGGL